MNALFHAAQKSINVHVLLFLALLMALPSGILAAGSSGIITPNPVIDTAAGRDHSLFLKSDGTVLATGLNSKGQLGDGTTVNKTSPVQVLSDVSAIADIGTLCSDTIEERRSQPMIARAK
jgi:hypothetical protein